jgi:hypothetical protein
MTSSSTWVVTIHSGRYLPTNPKQSPISSMKYSGRALNSGGASAGRGRLLLVSLYSRDTKVNHLIIFCGYLCPGETSLRSQVVRYRMNKSDLVCDKPSKRNTSSANLYAIPSSIRCLNFSMFLSQIPICGVYNFD